MFKRITLAATVLAVLVPAGGASARHGNAALMRARITTPAHIGLTAPKARLVSPQEALAAGREPGAVVEVARGMTMEQAVGLRVGRVPMATGGGTIAPALTPGVEYCWSDAGNEPAVQWGIYPMEQKVHDNTYWCAYYRGTITYRTQHVSLTSSLCSHHDPYGFKISGGAGYTWVTTRAGGAFGCPVPPIPYLTNNRDDWFNMNRNSSGTESYGATS